MRIGTTSRRPAAATIPHICRIPRRYWASVEGFASRRRRRHIVNVQTRGKTPAKVRNHNAFSQTVRAHLSHRLHAGLANIRRPRESCGREENTARGYRLVPNGACLAWFRIRPRRNSRLRHPSPERSKILADAVANRVCAAHVQGEACCVSCVRHATAGMIVARHRRIPAARARVLACRAHPLTSAPPTSSCSCHRHLAPGLARICRRDRARHGRARALSGAHARIVVRHARRGRSSASSLGSVGLVVLLLPRCRSAASAAACFGIALADRFRVRRVHSARCSCARSTSKRCKRRILVLGAGSRADADPADACAAARTGAVSRSSASPGSAKRDVAVPADQHRRDRRRAARMGGTTADQRDRGRPRRAPRRLADGGAARAASSPASRSPISRRSSSANRAR